MTDSNSQLSPHYRKFCLPLKTSDSELVNVGGKGQNLALLARAGFPVPDGFIIATGAYHTFVENAGLTRRMAAEADAIDAGEQFALSALSDKLRHSFKAADVPGEIVSDIRTAYAGLGRPAVAVRSSATAEDLPGMSFAGQQDTVLNVVDDDSLMRAVIECWSSLWTARAIAYRARNQIDNATVSLAVVVQQMVPSETSGVLFTANPLTGKRSETVIDATFGLGEALVSGQVEPDHYVVDSASRRILRIELGAKATVMQGEAAGGLSTEQADRSREQALSDDQIAQLTELGQEVARLYQDPQDIEWAFAGGKLFLLQSRPITSLFPVPSLGADDDPKVFVSLGAIQGIMGPFTPLGMDMLRGLFAGISRIFSLDASMYDQPLIHAAADRPWIHVTGALRNPLGRLIFDRALPLVEPGAALAIRDLKSAPQFQPPQISIRFLQPALPFLMRLLKSVAQAFFNPDAIAQNVRIAAEEHVACLSDRSRRAQTLDERLDLCEWLCYNAAFPRLLPLFIPPIVAGYASLHLLNRIAAKLSLTDSEISPQTALVLTRSLSNNVTTKMDLELWDVAFRIGKDENAASSFAAADASALAHQFKEKKLPAAIQDALEKFLKRYGMRGLAELDFGQPRWREHPGPIISALQSYLSIAGKDLTPDRQFLRGEQEAAQAQERLAAAADRAWVAPLGGWLVRLLAKRVRALAGFRESPKFTIIRLFGTVRSTLLESGQRLTDNGALDRPEDLFYLTMRELRTLALGAPGDWKKLVRTRRLAERNELRRRPIPRLLLSDGTAFYAGITPAAPDDDSLLFGSGVSPGLVEGTVKVVYNPLEAALEPGDILVCPGTDPAWTPLFLTAGGLVMEVGGMMTHGSVVAREYGIPAVAGVDRATELLQTGQEVRVDGSSGQIEMLG